VTTPKSILTRCARENSEPVSPLARYNGRV
jgi:hypothetical protein